MLSHPPPKKQVLADKAVEIAARDGHAVERVLVYENADAAPKASTPFVPGRDEWWDEAVGAQAAEAEVEWVDAEHPLFLLYTSGSTGE